MFLQLDEDGNYGNAAMIEGLDLKILKYSSYFKKVSFMQNTNSGWDLQANAQKCTMPVSAPTSTILSVPNNQNGKARYESAKQLVLKYDPLKGNIWEISFINSSVVLKFGKNYLKHMQKGIADIRNGTGDYAIGPIDGENCLWIWWMV
jgi:hypothetical protein